MHGSILQDLAVVLLISAAVTVLFNQLRQPVVLGYLVAGIIIGPHTPPFMLVTNREVVEGLAEVGVVLLMFSLGLHFSLRKLAQVGGTAFIAAFCEILLMVFIGYEVGQAFDWSFLDSLFLGALLSISSTTIIVKALGELKLARERFADLIFGILIVEDLLGIALLALLPSIALKEKFEAKLAMETLGELAIFLTCVLVIGLLVVPRLFRYIGRFESEEMLIVAALGICFGVALVSDRLGYSEALGAFLTGAIVAEAREGHKISRLAEPVRDMFSAIFFVTVGMLIDPVVLWEYAVPIVLLTVTVIVGKVLTCSFGTFIAGHDLRTSMRVGMGMAQIGEFSFIIAALGKELNVTSDFLYPIAVAVSAMTTLTTPYLIRSSDAVTRGLESLAPRPLLAVMNLYGLWLGRLGSQGEESRAARRRVWVPMAIVALNVALITGLLIAARALGNKVELPGLALPSWVGGDATLFWLGAMVLALPLVLATVRELRVLGTALAETHVADSAAHPEREATVHAIIIGTVTALGTAALGLWMIILSVTMVASWPALAGLAVLLAVVGYFLRRSMNDLYMRGQTLLHETLAHPPHHEERPAMPTLLLGAAVETIAITETSPAAGKLIRELALRTKTGASAVVIQRPGQEIVNPGPDDELRVGDRVLLLGIKEQIEAARKLLIASGARGT